MTTSELVNAPTLPTTIGSIVTFTGWADTAKTEPFLYVATLLVGAIDNGEKHSVVWGDAYVDGDGGGIFTEEEILAGDPTLIFEAKENVELLPLADEDAEPNYGEIVTYLDITDPSESEMRLTAVYTPGIVDQENEELSDAAWMNSYGGYVSWDALEAGSPLVYVKGSQL